MIWTIGYRIFSWLASLELAIFLILVLAICLATGTIYEAKYSAAVASQIVYRSVWMQCLLWLFVINIAAAAVSRIPWRRHHIGFLITHLGLIVLLVGSYFTQRFGVDGTMAIAPGESEHRVQIDEKVLNVYRAVPGANYELLLSEKMDFNPLRDFIGPKKLRAHSASPIDLSIDRYYAKARREVAMHPVPKGKGFPAVHFQLNSSRASFEDWLVLQDDVATSRDLGPARLRFQRGKPTIKKVDKPTLYLYVLPKEEKLFVATMRPQDKKLKMLGAITSGKPLPLGWMDFALKLEELYWSAAPDVSYTKLDTDLKGDGIPEALEVNVGGERVWVELGSAAQVSTNGALYYVQYTRKAIDTGVPVQLNHFKIGYYEGTTRPKSYSSLVTAGGAQHLISMNEPLTMNGYTFYQASYELDQEGKPTLSVLSVNYDPGRWIKYIGSLMIVFGILSMFYFKPVYSGKNKWLLKKPRPEATA